MKFFTFSVGHPTRYGSGFLFQLISLALLMPYALEAHAEPVESGNESGVIVIETRYENCRLTKVEPDAITITHSSGIATLPFAVLPESLRKNFGYDPAKAAAHALEKKAAAPVLAKGAVTSSPVAAADQSKVIAQLNEEAQAKLREREEFNRQQKVKLEAIRVARQQEEEEARRLREEANAGTKENIAKKEAKEKKKGKGKGKRKK